MIRPEQQLYARLGWQLARRFRWPIWRNAWRYMRSIPGARRSGPDHLPFTPLNAIVWVTNRCNKDCHFCTYIDGLNADDHRELEMSPDRFRQLLDLPLVRNCLRIGLYGGEPLLNRGVPGMIAEAKSRGHLVTLNTNGLLVRKRLDDLLASPPDLLLLSYYPEDRERTEEAIALTAPHMPVVINYMFSESRLSEIERLVSSAAAHGARLIRFNSYEPQGTGVDLELTAQNPAQQTTQTSRANREIPVASDDPRLIRLRDDLRRRYGHRIGLAWPATARRLPQADTTCRAFWHSTWLDARGQMSPCCDFPIAAFAGSVFDGSADWNSERMIRLRENMRRNVYSKICATCSQLRADRLGA